MAASFTVKSVFPKNIQNAFTEAPTVPVQYLAELENKKNPSIILSQDIKNQLQTLGLKRIETWFPRGVTPEFKYIGQGSFTQVLRSPIIKGGRVYALKQFSKQKPQFIPMIINEVFILQMLKNQNPDCSYILCYQAFLEDDYNYYIVTDYDDNYKTLEELLFGSSSYSTLTNNPLFKQYVIWSLCAGLRRIHTSFVVHRDIKPGNILINVKILAEFLINKTLLVQPNLLMGTIIKYIDFGISCYKCPSLEYIQKSGAIPFAAPEQLASMNPYILPNPIPSNLFYLVQKVDFWALGNILWQILLSEPHAPMIVYRNLLMKEGVIEPGSRVITDELRKDFYIDFSESFHDHSKRLYESTRKADGILQQLFTNMSAVDTTVVSLEPLLKFAPGDRTFPNWRIRNLVLVSK